MCFVDQNIILQKVIMLIGSLFYRALNFCNLIYSLVKNMRNIFHQKKRDVPPSCLNNPSLGVEHRFIQLKDIKLHYVCGGDPNKKLMLFIHGFPDFWFSWRHQLKEFSSDYFVVAIDQRGYGDSDKPIGVHSYTLDKMVEDIKQLLEGLNKRNIILVGHDWGGFITYDFTVKYGDLVDKLIILNAPHPLMYREILKKSIKQLLMSWYILFFNIPLLPEFALKINDYYFFDFLFRKDSGQPLLSSDELEAYKYTFQNNSFTYPLNYYRAITRKSPIKGHLGYQIKTPTLIIWSKKDKYLNSELAQPFKYVDDLDVKYIEDGSHWIQMEKPLVVNHYMRQYLSKN